MKNTHQNKQISAAITGAIVGAGVTIAGAVALQDKKTREKVTKVLTDAKNQAMGYLEDMQNQAQDTKAEAEEKFSEEKVKVKKIVTAVKNVEKEVKNI